MFAYSTNSWGDYNELWVTDGTPAGTSRLLAPDAVATVSSFHAVGGRLFFVGQSKDVRYSLWSTDGTPEGTAPIRPDLDVFSNGGDVAALPDNSLVLDANDGTRGAELWRYADVWAPVAGPAAFEPGPRPRIAVPFSEAVGPTLSAADLTVRAADTGAVVDVGAVALAYDAEADRAVFTLGGPLPDGNYRAELGAGSVTDVAGNPLARTFTFDFFVLAGDVDRNRVVNFDDLLILASNYNKTGKTWADGDLDGNGVVNFDDLLILAGKYNKALPAPAPAPVASMEPAIAPATSASVLREDDKAKPVFSTTRVAKPVPTPAKAKVVPNAKSR